MIDPATIWEDAHAGELADHLRRCLGVRRTPHFHIVAGSAKQCIVFAVSVMQIGSGASVEAVATLTTIQSVDKSPGSTGRRNGSLHGLQ